MQLQLWHARILKLLEVMTLEMTHEGPIEPPPCPQVLQASSIIHKPIDTLDDPVV